jgi:DNA-binding CsgD family transcriptional regulator
MQADARDCRCFASSRHLTDREAEILTLAASDLHDREIAEMLGISIRTVQQHVASTLRKTELHSRSGLIAYCFTLEVLRGRYVWPPQWSGKRCLAARC